MAFASRARAVEIEKRGPRVNVGPACMSSYVCAAVRRRQLALFGAARAVAAGAAAAATRGGARRGTAAALVGVVEASALEGNQCGLEDALTRSAALGARDGRVLGHGVHDLEDVAAIRASVVVTSHLKNLRVWVAHVAAIVSALARYRIEIRPYGRKRYFTQFRR